MCAIAHTSNSYPLYASLRNSLCYAVHGTANQLGVCEGNLRLPTCEASLEGRKQARTTLHVVRVWVRERKKNSGGTAFLVCLLTKEIMSSVRMTQ